MTDVNAIYRLHKQNGDEADDIYFIRRFAGGYATSKDPDGEFEEHKDYWELALKKYKENGYVWDEQGKTVINDDPKVFSGLFDSYEKKKKIVFRIFITLLAIFISTFAITFYNLTFVNDFVGKYSFPSNVCLYFNQFNQSCDTLGVLRAISLIGIAVTIVLRIILKLYYAYKRNKILKSII